MRSLRSKILGIQILAITAAVVILGSLAYALMIDSLLSVQRHNLTHLSLTSAHNIDRNLTDLQDKFRNIMIGRDMHRGSDLPIAKYLANYQETFPVLSLVNREGHEELSMIQQRIASPKELRNWQGTDIFNLAMANPNEVILSPAVNDWESSTPGITLGMAQVGYFGDEFKGILIGSAPVQKVLEKIDTAATANGEFLVVIDADQRIIYPAGQNDTQATLSQPTAQIESSLLATMRSSTSDFLEASVFGQNSYVAYQTNKLSGWTVLAVLPSNIFMAPPNHLRNITLLTCLVLLTAGVLIAQRLANRLTRDIIDLTEHTRQIAAGDLDSRVTITSQDEIAVLGNAFNEMTDRLQRSQDSRNRLDTILQSIIDPLLVTNAAGLVQRHNNAAMEMLQCTAGDLENVTLSQFFTEQFCPDSDKSLLTLAREGPVQNLETHVRTCAGAAIPVLLSCSYVKMATEQESGLVVILKDISIRKQIEAALNHALTEAEAARDQVNAILRSVADGLIVTDTNQNIVLMNRATEKLFGVELHQLRYKPVQNLIADRSVLDHLTEHMQSPSSVQDVEFEIKQSDGAARLIQARSAPVRNKKGLTNGLITTLRDVTEERMIERIKNEFISTAAHELNTPLTTIMGFTELLIESEVYGNFTDSQRKEFLGEILDKTDLLARIVSDLLDLSRMQAGQSMPLLKSMADLPKTILKAVRRYQVSDNSHLFDLELSDSEVIEILIDQQRIIQVLENLISNALKYSPPGSRITISTRRNGDYALVSIADQGIGMTEEQVRRIFDKFYRADASNTAIKGLGMGMSIVQTIIQAHEGTINVSSVPGAGTTVTFGLPLRSPETLQ